MKVDSVANFNERAGVSVLQSFMPFHRLTIILVFCLSIVPCAGCRSSGSRCVQGNCSDGKGVLHHKFVSGTGFTHYEGMFVGGKMDGQGKLENSTEQCIYEGEFLRDDRHGQGTYKCKDGRKYIGTWVKDVPYGKGTYTDPKGSTYQGKFSNGVLCLVGNCWDGPGRQVSVDGGSYSGGYKNGRMHGQGHLIHPRARLEYTGGFKDGLFEGHGLRIISHPEDVPPTESRYDGEFKNDFQHGQGKLTFFELQDGKMVPIRIEKGTFSEGYCGNPVCTEESPNKSLGKW